MCIRHDLAAEQPPTPGRGWGGNLSDLVILSNRLFLWEQPLLPSLWTLPSRHRAPGERSPHDSNGVGSPGRLGAGLQRSSIDRKCRTDTATRKLTRGWDTERFTELGYKARHCEYMTLLFSYHLYFYWSTVTFQCCVSFCCTAKWVSHMHAHTRQ